MEDLEELPNFSHKTEMYSASSNTNIACQEEKIGLKSLVQDFFLEEVFTLKTAAKILIIPVIQGIFCGLGECLVKFATAKYLNIPISFSPISRASPSPWIPELVRKSFRAVFA